MGRQLFESHGQAQRQKQLQHLKVAGPGSAYGVLEVEKKLLLASEPVALEE